MDNADGRIVDTSGQSVATSPCEARRYKELKDTPSMESWDGGLVGGDPYNHESVSRSRGEMMFYYGWLLTNEQQLSTLDARSASGSEVSDRATTMDPRTKMVHELKKMSSDDKNERIWVWVNSGTYSVSRLSGTIDLGQITDR